MELFEIFNNNYFIDVKRLEELINVDYKNIETGKEEATPLTGEHIGVVKHEVYMSLLQALLEEVPDDVDNNLGITKASSFSIPFKLAFNTFIINKIIKEI